MLGGKALHSITVALPDGGIQEYSAGISIKEAVESISAELARSALAGTVDGVESMARHFQKNMIWMHTSQA
jgi:hypothetical protein